MLTTLLDVDLKYFTGDYFSSMKIFFYNQNARCQPSLPDVSMPRKFRGRICLSSHLAVLYVSRVIVPLDFFVSKPAKQAWGCLSRLDLVTSVNHVVTIMLVDCTE